MLDALRQVPAWLLAEAKEKLDLRGTWAELKKLKEKYGRRFFVAAVAWELVEDVVFPALAVYFGAAWLVPVFLVLHFEPVVYPIFLFAFRTYDRVRGREPWEPPRLGQSTSWRAALQVLSYRVVALALFLVLLARHEVSPWLLTAYTVGMTLFSFVHDRIWHDSNFGIDVPTDTVLPKRVVAKVLSYRAVSAFVMGSLFYGLVRPTPWRDLLDYQLVMCVLHLVLGFLWARSSLGIRPTHLGGK